MNIIVGEISGEITAAVPSPVRAAWCGADAFGGLPAWSRGLTGASLLSLQLLGLPDADEDAFEEYSADVEEEEPEADHPQMGVSQQ